MPWLRHKLWKYATPLAPSVSHCASGRVYRCTGADDGAVNVPYERDAAELLHPAGDRSSEWVVAWDRYGVAFDGQGLELTNGSAHVHDSSTVVLSEPVVTVPKKRGRPPKR